MTGYEVLYEDAALARSIYIADAAIARSMQLAADQDYAQTLCAEHAAARARHHQSTSYAMTESEISRRRHRRRERSSSGRNTNSNRTSRSSITVRHRNPSDPPATGTALERPDGPECTDYAIDGQPASTSRSMRGGNSGSAHHLGRASADRRRTSSSIQCVESVDPLVLDMLSDGSNDEAKNKSLLYVPCEINDRLVEMMCDTGAQTSVISRPLMEKLCLDKKLNRDKQGVAAGVGSARIIGRIENCPVQIGHAEFLLYFAVLDVDQDMMILGVDQMRRFNCLVDLMNNKLIFGGKGGVEVDFFTHAL